MPSDESPRSPFLPGFKPKSAVPWADEPEAPRLSILHFLVGTACVAIYLGWLRTMHQVQDDPYTQSTFRILWSMYGVGAGLSLSGLLLWVTRSLRGISFPRHPGEYLLVAIAIGVLTRLVTHSIIMQLITTTGPNKHYLFVILTFFFDLPWMGVYLWAAIRVKQPGWRKCFLLFAGLILLRTFVTCGGMSMMSIGYQFVLSGLPGAVVMFLSFTDHHRGVRYPWSHWLGVSILWWSSLINIIWSVVIINQRFL